MASQSAWEQFKSARVTRNALIGLIIGILIGLTLGLLIGWVWWPVEYKEPAQASSTTALAGAPAGVSADAKPLYMGAIADAFVMGTQVGDPDAAASAAQRLAALGGDVQGSFNEAIDYYGKQANGSARVANLKMLAQAVGVPVGGAAAAAPAAGAAAAAAPAAGAAAAGAVAGSASQSSTAVTPTAAAPATNAGGGLGGWLLGLLTALVLIGGGIYLLTTLRRRQDLESEETAGGFADEEVDAGPAPASTFARSTLNPQPPPAGPPAGPATTYTTATTVTSPGPGPATTTTTTTATTTTTTATAAAAAAAGQRMAPANNDYGFDEEAADEESGPVVVYGSAGMYPPPADEDESEVDGDDGDDGQDTEDQGSEDGEWEESHTASHVDARNAQSSGLVTAVGATPPISGPRTPPPGSSPAAPATSGGPPPADRFAPVTTRTTAAPVDRQPAPRQENTMPPAAAALAAAAAPALQPPTPSRMERYPVVAQRTGEYHIGMFDFDFAVNIEDPARPDKYIGEFQMVIPDHGMLNRDMNKVIAFEIILFDKASEQQISTVERTLLSHYAHDNMYSKFERDKPSLAPIVAQSGVNFQLETPQLVLDCWIREVTYTSEGVFKSLVVDMAAKRKS